MRPRLCSKSHEVGWDRNSFSRKCSSPHLKFDELYPGVEHPNLSGQVKFGGRVRLQVRARLLYVHFFNWAHDKIKVTGVGIRPGVPRRWSMSFQADGVPPFARSSARLDQ